MLNHQLIDIYVIFKFLKNNGAVKPDHVAIFYYFGPELLERDAAELPEDRVGKTRGQPGNWYRDEWKYIHTEQKEMESKWSPSTLKVVCPEFSENLEEIDWDKHKEKRASGKGSSKILDAIREDNPDKFQREIAAVTEAPKIEWSIYEQHFPWPWRFTVSGESWVIECPDCLQAIGIYGAAMCFRVFCQDPKLSKVEVRQRAAGPIVGGGNLELVQDLVDKKMDFGDTLPWAIQFHRGELVSFLLDDQRVEPKFEAVATCIAYGNFEALRLLVDPPASSGRKGFLFAQAQGGGMGRNKSDTVYHICARYNAIEAFKFLLSKWTPTDKGAGFNAYDNSEHGSTFLHYGCRYAGYDVVRFWCRHAGNVGLDAVDEGNFNPTHYVFLLGINPKPSNHADPIEKRRPFYGYLKKRAHPKYDVSTDPNPDE
jgi:hypothetical protein